MPRQTAFPGIMVDSMEIEGMAPPEGGFIVENNPRPEEGIMEEAVNRGLIKDFEVLQQAAEFSSETVGEFIRGAEAQIGPFLDGFLLTYNLKVKGAAQVSENKFAEMVRMGIAERSVSSRARLFARVKNPFEPDMFEVSEVTKDERLTEFAATEMYDVSITVTK